MLTVRFAHRKSMSMKSKVLYTGITIAAVVFALSVPTLPAQAVNSGPLMRQEEKLEKHASAAATAQQNELTRIIQRADTMIQVRLTSLQNLLTRISSDKRLSDNQKSSMTADINTTISNLQALKAKIDADTDVTTARNDAKSIVTSYHVYATYEPKERLMVIIENLQTSATNVQSVLTRLSTFVDTLKSQGKDTTGLTTLLTDMNTKLTDITTKLSADSTLLAGVSVTNATYQTTFIQVRQSLATVRADYAGILSDFHTFQSQVKALKLTVSPTPTTTVTPTTTPVPTK